MKIIHYSETQHKPTTFKAQEFDAIIGSLEITDLHVYRNHNHWAAIYISCDRLITCTTLLQACYSSDPAHAGHGGRGNCTVGCGLYVRGCVHVYSGQNVANYTKIYICCMCTARGTAPSAAGSHAMPCSCILYVHSSILSYIIARSIASCLPLALRCEAISPLHGV